MEESSGIVTKLDDIIGEQEMRGGEGDGDTGSLRRNGRNGRGDQSPGGALSAPVCLFFFNEFNIIKKGCNTLRLLRNRYFLYRTL